ncbi:hypothetical protein GTR04_5583 [Trichophyton interdigitale]|nr:hypothetical protein GY631_5434 [Trichophyton interdigitale]KAG5218790.1 hypothetical protein GY632_5201 [Trichophyton interdigitale]KAG8207037.1 hypothetical protein GTR04_5583 [Trichophyton interdigitale]
MVFVIDEWLQSLAFSIISQLHGVLKMAGEPTTLTSVDDLDEYLSQTFSFDSALLTSGKRRRLDDFGTDTWNKCSKELSKAQNICQMETMKILCKLMVLSFLLLEWGMDEESDSSEYDRLFKAGLHATDKMIGMGLPDLAKMVLKKLDRHNSGISKEESSEARELAAEGSFQLSILTWKDRSKGLGIAQQPFPFAIESLEWKTKAADILFRIGMAKKREGDPAAIEWLQCCQNFVSAQSQEEQEADEQFQSIRQALLHELIIAYLELQKNPALFIEPIQRLHSKLEENYGSEPSTMFVGFEVSLALIPHVENGDARCSHHLQLLIKSGLAESHLRSILCCIHQFWLQRPGLAYNIFQQLIWGKLQHFESEVALIETLVLVFLRLCTADKDTSEGLRQSSSLFESLCGAKQKIVGLGFEASQAARVMFLSKANICFNAGNVNLAYEWCELAQHQVLEEGNKDIIQRKMLLYANFSENITPSRFNKLANFKGLSVNSQFLLYQLALKHGKLDTVRKSVSDMLHGSADFSSIYACIAYAESCNKISILGPIFCDLLNNNRAGNHTVPLLKCCIRIMAKEFSASQQLTPGTVEEICEFFEKFSTNICLDARPQQEKIQYLEWFSSNGYNLVTKNYALWDVKFSIRLIDCCIKILGLFPKALNADTLSNIHQRIFWCHSMATLAHLDIAYLTENRISRDLYFTSARMYLQQCQEYLTIRQDIAPEKWAKFCDVVRSLVALYFHRAINLNPENEEGICAVLSNCDASSDPQLLCILADRIMSSRLTTPAVYKAFQRATALKLASGTPCDVLKQFRWLRCLYQFGLKCDENCAKFMVGEAQKLVDIATNLRPQLSPELTKELCWEMQWLPVAVYNQSLTLYRDMKNNLSREWYNDAVDLVQNIEINGWDTDSLCLRMCAAYRALLGWQAGDNL